MIDSQLTPLKVLFITHAYPDFPGSFRGRLVYRMAQGLRSRGVQVHVLTPRVFEGSPLKETDKSGVRIYRFAYPSGNRILLSYDRIPVFRMLLFYLSGFIKGWALLRKRHYHIIHAHWLVPLGPLAVFLGKLFRRPTVVQAHGSDVHTYGGKNALLRRLLCYTVRKSDRALTVSRKLSARLGGLCGVENRRFLYFPTFIDGDRFAPASDRVHSTNLVYAGGFYENKGILVLLRAAERFLTMRPDLSLTILGDGPLRERTEKWARESGFEERVSMPGVVPYDLMPKRLRAALALILPSYQEGLPSVILEAMACGTPCIASNVGEIPSVIRHEVNGFLTRPGDFEQIGDAVSRLAADPGLRENMSVAARRGVEAYFTESAMDRLVNVYKGIHPF